MELMTPADLIALTAPQVQPLRIRVRQYRRAMTPPDGVTAALWSTIATKFASSPEQLDVMTGHFIDSELAAGFREDNFPLGKEIDLFGVRAVVIENSSDYRLHGIGWGGTVRVVIPASGTVETVSFELAKRLVLGVSK